MSGHDVVGIGDDGSLGLSAEEIARQYGDYRKLLGRIFQGKAGILVSYPYHPGGTKGPYSAALSPDNDETMQLMRRVHEYAFGGLLAIHRQRQLAQERTWSWARDMNIAAISPEVAESLQDWEENVRNFSFSNVIFQQPYCKHKLEELATVIEAMSVFTHDGAKFDSMPDEAAVALSHATGVPWHIVITEGEFRQMRVETEMPVQNPAMAVAVLQNIFKLPNKPDDKRIFYNKADNHVYIPAVFVTTAHVQDLRERRVAEQELYEALCPAQQEPEQGHSQWGTAH